MSKRFGRNQRRRLQQRVAELQHAHALDRELILAQRGTIDRQHATLANIAELLGPHYIGLEPRTYRTAESYREVRIPIAAMGPTTLCEQVDRSAARLRVAALQRVEVATWVERETERRHIRMRTPDGEMAYAYQPGAFNGVPASVLARHLAEQFAHHLASSPQLREAL